MTPFIVSARKYRPTLFSQVKSQEHVITTLKNAIKNDQVASALLFCGPRGSGKTTSARLLAKTINCQKRTAEGEPCNECTHCQQFQKQTSLNIQELDAASYNSAEDMRHLVEQMRYHPPKGKKNIIIIDEGHMLSNAASNVLLKPFEDPPPHIVFILVTTEKHKIIPTILSRCQVFDFHRIQEKDIISQLHYVAQKENIPFEPAALELISQKSDGSLRDALSTFDLIATYQTDQSVTYQAALHHLHLLDDQVYFDITDTIHCGDIGTLLTMYDQIMRKGFNGQDFITGWSQYLRNLLLLQTHPKTPLLKVPQHLQDTYEKKAQTLPTPFLYQLLAIAQEADIGYKNTLSQQIFVELMLIKGAQINNPNPKPKITTSQSEQKQKKVASIKKLYPMEHTDPLHTEVAESSSSYERSKAKHDQKIHTDKKLPRSIVSPAHTEKKQTQELPHSTPNNSDQASPQNISSPNKVEERRTQPADMARKEQEKKAKSPSKPLISQSSKSTSRIPSLKNIQAELKTTPTIKPQEERKPINTTSQPVIPSLTESIIAPHWQAYKTKFGQKGNNRHVVLLSLPISIQGNTIFIQITNLTHKTYLEDIKKDFTNYLRQQLAHPLINITTQLTEDKKNPPSHTPKEKLRQLTQSYPQVATLQQNLNLAFY